MRKSRGFTLIELILVIAILGILAISALPKFFDVSTQAKRASRDGVVGAVRAGVALVRANDLVTGGPGLYPATLDGVASNSTCGSGALCFATVLSNGIDDANWTKVTDTQYSYDDGTATTTYNYDTVNGTFQ